MVVAIVGLETSTKRSTSVCNRRTQSRVVVSAKLCERDEILRLCFCPTEELCQSSRIIALLAKLSMLKPHFFRYFFVETRSNRIGRTSLTLLVVY